MPSSRHGRVTLSLPVIVMALAATGVGCGSKSEDEASGPAAPVIPPTCNGHVELCDRRLDQVVFPSAHNAMSNADDGWVVPNQNHGMKRQLEDGVRGFLIDTHTYEDEAYLCHSICKFGSIKLVDALTIHREFLDAHRGEVLAFIIEDGISAEDTDKAFRDSGLVKYVYTHEPGTPWPTLREMIAKDTRLLVTAENGRPPPAWYQHVWDLAWDTPYTYDSKEQIAKTGCDVNRGDAKNDLFLINHWIGTPISLPENAMVANTYEVLSAHVSACKQKHGRLPTFVAVDFYDIGALFRVVDEANGL